MCIPHMSIIMLLQRRERVVSGTCLTIICCIEFRFRYTGRKDAWSGIWISDSIVGAYNWSFIYQKLYSLPDSASSYSEVCALIGLSASMAREGDGFWFVKELELVGVVIWALCTGSSASLVLLKFDLLPWEGNNRF